MTAPETVTSPEPSGPVLYDVTDGVATIRLNRPEAMNSLDIATKELLRETVRHAAEDPAVRCVVLTGTGRAFCTGQDLKEHIQLLESGSPARRCSPPSRSTTTRSSPRWRRWRSRWSPPSTASRPAPGASLAFACDLRIVADTAGFNLAFANVALSCDTGSSYTLQRLVGPAKALELLYFPRTIKADEALELGLATQVVPADDFDATVAELAGRLAAGPTVALGAMRRSVALRRLAHLRGGAGARGRR